MESLQTKLLALEKSYEAILQDAFDALALKMETARQKWHNESDIIEKSTFYILSDYRKDLKPDKS